MTERGLVRLGDHISKDEIAENIARLRAAQNARKAAHAKAGGHFCADCDFFLQRGDPHRCAPCQGKWEKAQPGFVAQPLARGGRRLRVAGEGDVRA